MPAVLRAVLFMAGAMAMTPMGAGAADTTKTLRAAFENSENGFDPQVIYDVYSADICRSIFDTLYAYDYFARPVRIVPNTAAGPMEISDGGRTYTVRVKSGIYFAADRAFKGRRELVAEDYVYSIKRIFDPKLRSYWLYVFEHRLAGLDAVLDGARKTGRFDYDAKIDGLQAIDRYTLRIRFTEPFYTFQHWLTFYGTAAVAREVVEANQDASNRVMEHPVGTGPYRLKEWIRGQRIVLEANPDYRDERYPAPDPGSDGADASIAKANAGKKLPIVGRVEVAIIEEAQPRLLSFDSGQLDYLEVPRSLADNVLIKDKLNPSYVKRGIALHRLIEPSLSFTFFNLDDPVVGGYTPEKIALRRAITMSYDRKTDIEVLRNGQAIPATQLVPPGIPGHDLSFAARDPYDPAAARALLDKLGYKDRDGDGYREMPDGKPLTIVKASTPTNADRTLDELWKKSMDAIGIRITFTKNKWPELNKMSEAGQLQMWNLSWAATTADGDAFASPLYSKNVGTSNDARFRLPEYDRLYDASVRLPEGAERTALYRRMSELVVSYAPWILGLNPYESVVAQPWLKGYKQSPFFRNQWKYYDVAAH